MAKRQDDPAAEPGMRPERGPMPQVTGRPEFTAAVRHAVPDEWPDLVAKEVFRHRATADGVTPKDLVDLKRDLDDYCRRLAEWRGVA